MTDSHDNEAAERVRGFLDWQDDGDLIASAYDENEGVRTLEVDDLRAVLAENKTMRQRLGLVAEEVRELPEMCRNLVGPRCGEAYDRAREAHRLVGEWTEASKEQQS